jgi:hypothetical protein
LRNHFGEEIIEATTDASDNGKGLSVFASTSGNDRILLVINRSRENQYQATISIQNQMINGDIQVWKIARNGQASAPENGISHIETELIPSKEWKNGYTFEPYSITLLKMPVRQTTHVRHSALTIQQMELHQNYPNPFNPKTSISFSIAKKCKAILKVYNLHGQEIDVLINEEIPSGKHSVRWDACDLVSGVYIYRLQAGDFISTRKMTLLR